MWVCESPLGEAGVIRVGSWKAGAHGPAGLAPGEEDLGLVVQTPTPSTDVHAHGPPDPALTLHVLGDVLLNLQARAADGARRPRGPRWAGWAWHERGAG